MRHSDIQKVWPPLIKGDLSILRVRIGSLLEYLEDDVVEITRNLDYITAANVMLYSLVYPDWFRILARIGVFKNRATLIYFGKAITPSIKRILTNEEDRQPFAEINSLAGYQQAEPEGWDMKAEVEELAFGGGEHGLVDTDETAEFARALEAVASKVTHTPKYQTFEEYIRSGAWMTSGSSSIGQVEWSYGDSTGKFKCRKNMLFAYFTAEELIEYSLSGEPRLQSSAFVKPELAKRRIAIASEMKPYLLDSYIFSQAGHNYKNYEFVTLEESVDQEQERIKATKTKLERGWALPFDFAGFDRQPTTEHILQIYRRVTQNVDPRVKPYVQRAISNYGNSYISYRDGDGLHNIKTTGGLPSGVKPTSVIGNVWNAVQMYRAREITRILLGGETDVYINARGDDSEILSASPVILATFRIALAAINAIGSNSKFGISQGHVEFLRNNLTTYHQKGWTCRTIPSFIQRKPWNSEPWKPAGDTETLFGRIGALQRRSGQQLEVLTRLVTKRFTKLARLDSRWLSIPVRSGGFGLLKDRGWRASKALPTLTRPSMSVDVTKPYPLPDWVGDINPYDYSRSVVSSLIVVDDVPGTGKLMRQNYYTEMRKVKPNWTKIKLPFIDQMPLYIDLTSKIIKPQPPRLASSKTNSTLMEFITEYNLVRKFSELPSLSSMLQIYFPDALQLIRQWTKRGWHMTDAINIILGDKPIEPRHSYHPLLNRYAKQHLWDAYRPQRWKTRETIASRLSVASTLVSDSLSRTVIFPYYLY